MLRDDAIRGRLKEITARMGGDPRGGGRELARRSRVAPNLVSAYVRGAIKSTTIETLEKIAKGAGVSFDFLVTGRRDPTSESSLDLTTHRHPEFPAAARAFLDLYPRDDEPIAVVRAFLSASFDANEPWSVDDWFDALRAEYRRRKRHLSISMIARR